jgi:hypothetical protein
LKIYLHLKRFPTSIKIPETFYKALKITDKYMSILE